MTALLLRPLATGPQFHRGKMVSCGASEAGLLLRIFKSRIRKLLMIIPAFSPDKLIGIKRSGFSRINITKIWPKHKGNLAGSHLLQVCQLKG